MTEPTASPDVTELLGCPFCGCSDIIASNVGEDEDNWFVGCMKSGCGVNPGVFCPDSEAEAIAAWNRRAPDLALRQEVERLTRERNDALGRTDELEGQAEHVSAEFEKDCWKAMRSLLDQCGFDWSADDAVTADDARTTIHDELEYRHARFERATARAEAAEASLRLATQRREDVVETLRSLVAKLDECQPHIGSAFAMQQMRSGVQYSGPTYADELEAARAALQPKEN